MVTTTVLCSKGAGIVLTLVVISPLQIFFFFEFPQTFFKNTVTFPYSANLITHIFPPT